MKILCINPPNSGKSIPEEQYDIQDIKMIFRGEPLALETLAGNLDGHDVAITDLKAAPDSLWTDVEQMRPDVVGLTGVACEANAVLDIARQLKERVNPVVVVGGHHASCDPSFFNREEIDYVAAGLGKKSFRELIDAIQAGTVADGVPGVAKTDPDGPLRMTPRRFTADDLVDDRPPRYDLVVQHRDQYVMSGVGGKIGFVATAFGCTHRCAFCAVPNITGGRYLTHSVDAVMRDIGLLGDIPLIRLTDANTFGDAAASEALGRRIIDSGMTKKFVADVRSDTVVQRPELFELWKAAGLATAVIGFEEITDDRLKGYRKGTATATNIRAMEILKALGIRIIGDFIVSPDYTPADFDALERFAVSHAIDLPLPSILTPLPGTPLYDDMKDRITIHDLDYYTFLNAVVPTRMPEEEFYETYAALWKRFMALKHG